MLTRSHRLRGRRHIRLQNLAFCLNKNSDYFKSFTTDAWLQEVTMILVKTLYWCLYDADRFVIILVIFPILGIDAPESQIGHQQKRSPTSELNIDFTLQEQVNFVQVTCWFIFWWIFRLLCIFSLFSPISSLFLFWFHFVFLVCELWLIRTIFIIITSFFISENPHS